MIKIDKPCVVLVGSKVSGNIGAVARAMMNMGFDELRLADPAASHLNNEAMERAMEARPLLEKAQVFTSLKEAIQDCHHAVATSGKLRRAAPPDYTPRDFAGRFGEFKGRKVALVFGPEDKGLTNDTFRLCDVVIEIPTSPEFTSLNLSHAVMVVLYELFVSTGEQSKGKMKKPATAEGRESFFEHLKEALTVLGFLDPQNPERIMKDLRNIFFRAEIDPREIKILRGICRQILNRAQ